MGKCKDMNYLIDNKMFSRYNKIIVRSHCIHPIIKAHKSSEVLASGIKALRDRMSSVKKTKKITDAMKLVAAAKVRRAQEAVVNGRPFAENLVKVLNGVNQRARNEDLDTPLTNIRSVISVMLVVVTGDRGLCGGYNSYVIKKAVSRIRELDD